MMDHDVLVRPDEEITYRSVSVLSIVGLVIGLLAPLCLLAPLLWAIPIVGAAISLAAIVRIAASDGALVGRGAAVLGLALCVASISAAASRSVSANLFVSRQAREVALEWIATLQAGDEQRAFEQTVEAVRLASSPPSPEQDLGDVHGHQPAGDQGHGHEHVDSPLERFHKDPVVNFLITDGAKMAARFDGDLAVEFGPRRSVNIQQQFALRPVGSSAAAETVSLQIVLVRSDVSTPGPSRWLISKYQSDDLPSPAAAAR